MKLKKVLLILVPLVIIAVVVAKNIVIIPNDA